MKIDRRLTFIGVMLVVLSMTIATQYATTKVGYTYTVVHPSNADIRLIGSDNSTDDNPVLRVDGTNASGSQSLKLQLGGNWSSNFNKTYTAAFGIVNEENFSVTITNISVTAGAGSDYMQIWLHSDRDKAASEETSTAKVCVWNQGTQGFNASSTVWVLAAGNGDSGDINCGGTLIDTDWDENSHVQYSQSDEDAINGTDDYVWVQVSVDIPSAGASTTYNGIIFINFKANTD